MRVDLRLANWRIAAKVLLAPSTVLALLLGLIGLGGYEFDYQKRNLRTLTEEVLADYQSVALTRARLSDVQASVYQILSIAANEADAKGLQDRIEDTLRRLDAMMEAAAAVRALALDPATLAAFGGDEFEAGGRSAQETTAAMVATLTTYGEEARNALDVVTVDTGTALIFMTSVEDYYRQAIEMLRDLDDRTRTLTTAAGAQAVSRLDTATVEFYAAAAAAALAVLISFVVARAISRPVGGLTQAMESLAGGTVDIEVPYAGQKDEIGAMARALRVFRDNAAERLRLERAQAEEREAKQRRAERIEEVIRTFDAAAEAALGEVASAGDQMRQVAQQMAAVAEQASHQSEAVARASSRTGANVQTVAAATEELSASIEEIGQRVQQSAQIAQRAVGEAERTGMDVQALASAAQRIGEVVDLIQSIAAQTNLLALNATIEAARAGEAGKGFAVVASEVKNLATQTAKATEEIAAQIAAIQSASGGVVTAITGVGATIRDMNEIAATIAAAVEEQTAATREIARNVQQAAEGTQEVESNVDGMSAAAAETGRAAADVLAAVGRLAEQSAALQAQVARFLEDIKAA